MAKYVTVQVTRKETPPAPGPVDGRPAVQEVPARSFQTAIWRRISTSARTAATTIPCRAAARVAQLADPGSVSFIGDELRPADPLEFFDLRALPERFSEAAARDRAHRGHPGRALHHLRARPAALGVMDFKFMGGSMGSVWASASTVWRRRPCDDRRALWSWSPRRAAPACRRGSSRSCRWPRPWSRWQLLAEAGLPLRHHPHPSHHGRRVRQFRHRGRHHHGRAGRGHAASPGPASSSRPPGRSCPPTSARPRSQAGPRPGRHGGRPAGPQGGADPRCLDFLGGGGLAAP